MSTIAHVNLITLLIVFGRSQGVPIFIEFDITLVPKSVDPPSEEPPQGEEVKSRRTSTSE